MRTLRRLRPLATALPVLTLGALAAVFGFGAASCASEDPDPFAGPKGVDLAAEMPERLSELNLLRWTGEDIDYADEVVPYELNTALFSDYAVKRRAIYIPEGKKATYRDNEVLDFPVGTVIVKTFLFPVDVREPDQNLDPIETRVLVRYEDGWASFPYVWDERDEDATLQVSGKSLTRTFTDEDGAERTSSYLVPQKNQCASCHELKDQNDVTYMTPIGPKPRHLNRDHDYDGGTNNQLAELDARGLLEGMPALSEVDTAVDFSTLDFGALDQLSKSELDEAARDYLDINCAHCHNPAGVNGISSQLFLNHDNTDRFHLGVCKKPGSAGTGNGGLTYDIVPGQPEQSILWFRMDTEQEGAMMPLLGRSLAHTRGNDLVYEWIAGLEDPPCSDQ